MFKAPNPDEFEDKPQVEMTRKNGSILRAYKHKTDEGRFRITVDDKPFDPTSSYENAIEKGSVKKK